MRSRRADHRSDHTDQLRERRVARSGSMLATLLPGLLSLAVIFGTLAEAHAQAQSPTNQGSMPNAEAIKAAIDAQLDQLPSGDEGVAIIMGELNDKLALSAEQQTKINPIITDTVASMEKIRDRYKAGEISAMGVGMQLQMAGQKAATQVEPLLTPAQSTAYAAMRQEQRRAMMKAMQPAQAAAKSPAPGTAQ